MESLRLGNAETNSSSVHVFCVQKKRPSWHEFPHEIKFKLAQYGRLLELGNACDYVWTYVNETFNEDEVNKFRKVLINFFHKNGTKEVRFQSSKSKLDKDGYPNYWIDHSDEFDEIFSMLFDKDFNIVNEDFLTRFLLDSEVIIGGDEYVINPGTDVNYDREYYDVYIKDN